MSNLAVRHDMRSLKHAAAPLFALLVAVMLTSSGKARADGVSKLDSTRGRARIIAPAELAQELADVIVIDARESGYSGGHVPGSRPMQWEDWTLERPNFVHALFGNPAKWGQAPLNDSKLQERLRAFGLSNSRPVVVIGSPRGWGEEGRVAWNLLYWGLKDVALLDGGYPAWVQAGMPVETGEPQATPSPGDFTLRPDDARRVTLGELINVVKANSRPLLDARSLDEYNGARLTGQRRGGHIPNSRSLPELSLYQADGRYIESAQLAALAKLEDGRAPITYCTGGVRSALLAILLETRLGIRAENYDGSIWEWSSHRELPLAPP